VADDLAAISKIEEMIGLRLEKMGVQVFCAPGEAGAFQWVQIPRGQSLAGSLLLKPHQWW
jgi:hypothetical protein